MHVLARTLLASLAGLVLQAQAAVHDIDVGTPLARFALVKPGTHHYLRYAKEGDAIRLVDIWARTVSFEDKDGKQLLRVRQRWDGVTPKQYTLLLDSWAEPGTFRPISHERVRETDGQRRVEGFVFAPTQVTGMPGLADNVQKDLVVPSSEPTYNFETDIEFLQALPMAEGEQFSINFYHPGGKPLPQRYLWKVVGSENIAGPAGPVECWVVTTDYNQPGGSVTKFWFAKGSQVMVREESPTPKGSFVKTLVD